MIKTIIKLNLLIFLFFSCSTYNEEQILNFDKLINEHIQEKSLDFEKSGSGLYYKIIQEGKGDFIQISDSVQFTYEGSILNGEMFDKQSKPITFKVQDLIQGWKEIILKSKPGTEVELIVPPHLGYGDHDLDDIPPNSTLFFKMKIISIL